MRRKRLVLALGLALLTAVAALGFSLAVIAPAVGTEEDKGILAGLISRALSSPGMKVSIGAVDGALSSDATVRNIVISDARGAWLKLDQARIEWTRSALLARRLEINRLEIGKLEILRRPVASGAGSSGKAGPLLPELPVKVVVGHFALGELVLGEPVLGSAARLTAAGKASLGNPSQGLDLDFDAHRLDAPGSLAIRLGFVPQSANLTLQLSVQEPAGGLLAHLASLPGLPPVALDLGGNGPLDHFTAKLAFSAGPDAGADGTLNLARDGSARRLALDLEARLAAFLPPGLAPLFAGSTELAGNIRLGDDGSVGFDRFSLTARTARLDVSGTIGADRSLDLQVAAHELPAPPGERVAPASAKQLDLDIAATGTLAAPHIDARVAVAGLSLPAGHFAKFDARLLATPTGNLLDSATRIDFKSEAQGSGLDFKDPKWAAALGDRVAANLNGRLTPSGQADLSARLALAGAEISYAGKIGPRLLNGKLEASVADLARFARLAGMNLRGRASLAADLDGAPNEGRIGASLSGSIQDETTGNRFLDGLTGGRLTWKGKLSKTADGFAFSNVELVGAHLAARLDGAAGAKDSNVTAAIDLPDLHYADSRLRGRANLTAALKGPLGHAAATARLAVTSASALGRPIPRLLVEAEITDPFGALQAKATLDGEVGGKPAQGEIALSALAGGGWRLDPSRLAIGTASFAGAASLDKSSLAAGHLSLAAGNLDDLSPFALRKLAGRFEAQIDLDVAGGKQNLALVAEAKGIRAAGPALERLAARLRIRDLYGAPTADGTLAIDGLAVAGAKIPRLLIDAKASPQATRLAVSGEAQGFAIAGRALFSGNPSPRLDLAMLQARRGNLRIALAQPASLRFSGGGIETAGLAVAAAGGRLDLVGRAGRTFDLSIELRHLPLALAKLVEPKLDLVGTLDGAAHIAGSAAAPSGDWQMRITRLAAKSAHAAGLPLLDVAASGRLGGGSTRLEATIRAGAAGELHLAGSAPIGAAGALDVTAKGVLDVALANNILAVGGRKVAGKVTLDMRATGSLEHPQVSGSALLGGASFSDPASGIRLTDIEAELSGRGDEIDIAHFSAATANSGTISASGAVKLSPQAGFPGHLAISGRHAQIVANSLVAATADLDLQLSGALAERPRIDGSVTLQSMNISVPDRLPVTLRPLPGTKHVDPGATAKLLLAEEKRRVAAARHGPSSFDPDLRLEIAAPNRIFVRGRGIDAEFGGELELSGTLAKPVANGAFDLRSGRLNLLAQRLDLSRGRLSFAGDLVPELDFVAEAQATDVTAQVTVTGTAAEPVFTMTSTPSLPQDEILSRIIFRKPAGGLSPVQAIQLAQIVAELSGSGAGLDVFEKMRKALGVDSFDVGTDAQGNASVGASRYITNNVSVGVRSGANPQSSAVSVGVDITKRLRAQGEVGVDGSSSVGLGMQWEY